MRLPATNARARRRSTRGAFTLVEMAVTIAIVGIALTASLQTLTNATTRAAHTRNLKTARELGLYTLGQIESGLYWDDIDSSLGNSYSELGYPDYYFEAVLGDEQFADLPDDNRDRPFNNWEYQEQLRREREDYDEDEEEAEQPYEKVRVKVIFPTLRDLTNHVILERWIPWEQVYGPSEDDEGGGSGSSGSSGDEGDR